ncbi:MULTISPECIES: TolC family protein [Olivibacter]|uniref:TolC family protein n=1 Tax=Olivibacter oleidegradans TaxID=760123 RepID=A0ABV6HMR4_9SPHI|nr:MULTISPECIES: TolC family protein [Olivibacter]MDX3915425.1 TolC family protein [Pseudosphingobacterium sp.]QEL02930.1 TolC family protein [Olivibacter sp. LS-1]
MRIQFTLISMFFLACFNLSAQESIIEDVNYAQLERFIELAKEHYPRKKMFEAAEEKAKAGVPAAKVSYLDILNASYFYRPEGKSAIDVVNPYIINGFQFGATLNVGNFLQKPHEVKQAKADYKLAQYESKEYDILLSNEVKKRYYDYILQQRKLKIKTQAEQDANSLMEDLRFKFEKAEITHDVYSEARAALTTAETDKVEAEADFLKSRDALEDIIGMKLTEIN